MFGRDDCRSAYRQQIGKQSDGLVLRLSAVVIHDAPQFCKLVLGAIVVFEPGRPLQVRDDRVQGAVLMVRGTEILDADISLPCQVLRQRRDQAGLADAGLARQQHDAALALFSLLPTPQQQVQLLLAADQWGQCCGAAAQCLEAAFDSALGQDAPGLDRHRKPL